MKKITYVCNLCNGEFSETNKVFGIRWTPGNTLEIKPSIETESHLCRSCATDLKRELAGKV